MCIHMHTHTHTHHIYRAKIPLYLTVYINFYKLGYPEEMSQDTGTTVIFVWSDHKQTSQTSQCQLSFLSSPVLPHDFCFSESKSRGCSEFLFLKKVCVCVSTVTHCGLAHHFAFWYSCVQPKILICVCIYIAFIRLWRPTG